MFEKIYKGSVRRKYGKKNIRFDGIDEKEMWKGLKKYMEDYSMLKERKIPEIAIWEHFLVYATAFGIADKVIKQLKIVYKEFGRSLYLDDSSYGYICFLANNDFSSSLTNTISSTFSSTYEAGYSYLHSSGSGGGGGFSILSCVYKNVNMVCKSHQLI